MKVKENERERRVKTAHPHCTHTHAAVRGSPAVHADHNNTPEKERKSQNTRRTRRGKKKEVTGRGGMEGGNEGEVGKQSNNLGLRELRRRMKERSSVQLLPTLQVQSEVSKRNPLSLYVHPIFLITYTKM